jgi:hypothetical protein
MYALIFLCQKPFAKRLRFFISLNRKTTELKEAPGSMQTILHHFLGFITVRYTYAQSKVFEILNWGILNTNIDVLGVNIRWHGKKYQRNEYI